MIPGLGFPPASPPFAAHAHPSARPRSVVSSSLRCKQKPAWGSPLQRSAPHIQVPSAPNSHSSQRQSSIPSPPARSVPAGAKSRPTPRSPKPLGWHSQERVGPCLRRRSAEGAGARLGGDEGTGVSDERDAVLGRRRAGAPAGRPLLPLLSRRLPGPGAPWRRGTPGPLGHAAQLTVPGGGRLRAGRSGAAARGR